MTNRSLAQSAHETTRLERGIALAQDRFEGIECTGPYAYSVPSCTGEGVYTVDLKHARCSCPDRTPEGEECKHVHAARYFKARTAKCAGCYRRFRHRKLHDVPEGHLMFFEGEVLCGDCAREHGAL